MVVFLLLACCFKVNLSFTIDAAKWSENKIRYSKTLSSTTLDIVGAASGSDGTSIYLFGGTPENDPDSPYTVIHKYTPSSDKLTTDTWDNWGVSSPSKFVIETNKYSQSTSSNGATRGATYISAIDWKADLDQTGFINKFYAQLDGAKSAEYGAVSDNSLYNTQSGNSRGCLYIFQDLAYITGKVDRSIDSIDINVASIALSTGSGKPQNKMHACVLYNDSSAYTFGGEDYTSLEFINIHACEPDYSSCNEITNTRLQWQHLQAVVVDELIFIACGSIQDEVPYSYADIYVFDPATNQLLGQQIPGSLSRVDSHIHYLPDSKQLVFIGGKSCGSGTYCSSGSTILTYTFYELTDSPTLAQPTASPTMFPTAVPTLTTTPPTMPPSFPSTTADPTSSPTTNVPTTDAPTTDVPTTNMPTTNIPTTFAPTTSAPTTNAPTTNVPTTDVPTTNMPTTDVPTYTETLTTNIPTTFAPTTSAPTTNAPTISEAQVVVSTTGIGEQVQGENNAPSNSTSSAGNLVIYGVVGGVLVIGIVVALLICILKRKGKQTEVISFSEPRELRVVHSSSDGNKQLQEDGDFYFGQMLNDKSVLHKVLMDDSIVEEINNITALYPQEHENNSQPEPGLYRTETFEVTDDEGDKEDLVAANITAGNAPNAGAADDGIVEMVDNITKGREENWISPQNSPEHDKEVVVDSMTIGGDYSCTYQI